jgi:hypothetical protein
MASAYTEADVAAILNSPADIYIRAFGSAGAYTKSIFTNGSAFSYTPEVTTQAFDNTGDVYDAIATESGEVTFAIGKIYDLDYMSTLSGGLFTKTTTSAGATACDDQVIAAGWTDKAPIAIELVATTGGASLAAVLEPAITSVDGDSTSALVANDDYTIIPDSNSPSGYSIVLNSSGTKSVPNTEVITIEFNSPVVVASVTLTGGGKKNYDAVEGYFDSELKDGTPAKVYFHKGFYNGNINMTYGTENSPEAVVSDVVISLKNDSSRAAGAQMWSIVKG